MTNLCQTCQYHAWARIGGATVIGCPKHRLRFGQEHWVRDGRVNRELGCVEIPKKCKDYLARPVIAVQN